MVRSEEVSYQRSPSMKRIDVVTIAVDAYFDVVRMAVDACCADGMIADDAACSDSSRA